MTHVPRRPLRTRKNITISYRGGGIFPFALCVRSRARTGGCETRSLRRLSPPLLTRVRSLHGKTRSQESGVRSQPDFCPFAFFGRGLSPDSCLLNADDILH